MNTKTLTPDQARAEFFPCMSRGSFYEALRRGEIPSLRVGRRFLIPRTAVEKFLADCGLKVGAAAQ
jgi:excisionase family DNA binding protein